jgi:hypothetical protein
MLNIPKVWHRDKARKIRRFAQKLGSQVACLYLLKNSKGATRHSNRVPLTFVAVYLLRIDHYPRYHSIGKAYKAELPKDRVIMTGDDR